MRCEWSWKVYYFNAQANGFTICFNIRSVLLNDVERCRLLEWANGFHTSSTFDSTKLHERPGIQSQAATAVVTMDTDMDTSLRDRLVRRRIPNSSLFSQIPYIYKFTVHFGWLSALIQWIFSSLKHDTVPRVNNLHFFYVKNPQDVLHYVERGDKRLQLHSTFAITKEMLNGCWSKL